MQENLLKATFQGHCRCVTQLRLLILELLYVYALFINICSSRVCVTVLIKLIQKLILISFKLQMSIIIRALCLVKPIMCLFYNFVTGKSCESVNPSKSGTNIRSTLRVASPTIFIDLQQCAKI